MAALLPGAAIDAALGLVTAALLVRASLRRPAGRVRIGHQLLAAGFLLSAIGFVVTVVDAGIRWTVPLVPLAAAVIVAELTLLGAALHLAWRTDGPGAAIRRTADGAVIASSAAYAAWVLMIHPLPIHDIDGALTGWDKLVGLLVLSPGVVAISVCATVAWRTRRSTAFATGVIVLGGAAGAAVLPVAAAYGGGDPIALAAGLYAIALIALCRVIRRPPPAGPVARAQRTIPTGTLLAWAPVAIAIAACIVALAVYHHADNVSILIAAVIGAALAGRQTLATRDLREYAGELERRERLYRSLAHTDPLTELANRRSFVQVLHEQVVGGPPSAVLAIDLDGFKNVNDLRGHDVGDAVLVEVARRLRTNLRPNDIPARLGGDEFAVVLWLNPAEAAAAASRLRAVLSRPYEIGGSIVYLSASIGLTVSDGAADVPEVMRSADVALRFAKLRGKDRVEGYAEAFVTWLRRRNTVESSLRGAIEREELSLLYQPVVELPSCAVVGAEALLRWHSDELGSVSPAEFIPIAEGSGLIDDIGRWVMAEACRQLSRWIIDGHRLWLSVNVSVRELHRPDYADQVAALIRLHHVPADRLVLEVTEHAVAIDPDVLITTLAALRDTGLRIALDDFGAGYSVAGPATPAAGGHSEGGLLDRLAVAGRQRPRGRAARGRRRPARPASAPRRDRRGRCRRRSAPGGGGRRLHAGAGRAVRLAGARGAARGADHRRAGRAEAAYAHDETDPRRITRLRPVGHTLPGWNLTLAGAPPVTARTAVIWAALRKELDRRAGEKLNVVDVGGGTGGFAVPFAEDGHSVTVIDASPDALASLARRAADAGVADRIIALQGDGDQLGSLIAPGTADLVLCHSVLEQVDDPAAVLAAIDATLRPGGIASIVVSNRSGAVLARILAGQARAAIDLLEDRPEAGGERRRFDAESAAALMRSAGFTVEAIMGVRVAVDLMPGALADADPAGILEFELATAALPPFRDIATQLHILASAPR